MKDELGELTRTLNQLRRCPKIGLLYELYTREHNSLVKPRTVQHQDQIWGKHLYKLCAMRADKISPLEYQHLVLNELVERGTYNTAANVTRLILTVLDFGVAIGIISANPLSTVNSLPLMKQINRKIQRNVQHRPSFDHQELNKQLRGLVKTFHEKATDHRIRLLRISLALLLRPSEIVTLNINRLDPKAKTITVENTKTLDQFPIPLDDFMLGYLQETYELYGNKEEGWVFKGHRQIGHLSAQTLNKALKLLGYKNILCAHGIRAIGSNFFAHHAKDVPPYVREAILQHSVSKVEKAYRRDDFYLKQRRKAMQLWYDYLAGVF